MAIKPLKVKKTPTGPGTGTFGGSSLSTLLKAYPNAQAQAAAGTTAAKAATAPPPPPPSAPPVDPLYDAEVAGARRSRDDTLAGLGASRTRTLQDYGYVDTKGDGTDLQFDPSNPFSKAALLRKNWQEQQTGNTNSYAARGQLYAGSLINAKNATDFSGNQSENAMRSALAEFLANNTQQAAQAKSGYETNTGISYGNMVGRAASNPLYSPTTDAPKTLADYVGDPAVTAYLKAMHAQSLVPKVVSSKAQKTTTVKKGGKK